MRRLANLRIRGEGTRHVTETEAVRGECRVMGIGWNGAARRAVERGGRVVGRVGARRVAGSM